MTEPETVRTILSVLAVETDAMRFDSWDTDPVHVWVDPSHWGRRAVNVQGTQFAEAAGCPPEELPGKHFFARLPADLPEYEPGERIDFLDLEYAPPLTEEEEAALFASGAIRILGEPGPQKGDTGGQDQ